jgi:hypothetical protein
MEHQYQSRLVGLAGERDKNSKEDQYQVAENTNTDNLSTASLILLSLLSAFSVCSHSGPTAGSQKWATYSNQRFNTLL